MVLELAAKVKRNKFAGFNSDKIGNFIFAVEFIVSRNLQTGKLHINIYIKNRNIYINKNKKYVERFFHPHFYAKFKETYTILL